MNTEGQAVCGPCNLKLLPQCLECRKPIENEYLMAFSSKYHKECFKCQECKVTIGRGHHNEEGKFAKRCGFMVCLPCYEKNPPKCLICKVANRDKAVIYVGRYSIPFHPECFKCAKCGAALDKDEKLACKKNSIYHPACAPN